MIDLAGLGGEFMIGDKLTCASDKCDVEFVQSTHNQKYCSNECCRYETNRKIIAKYHEKAAIRKGRPRICRVCGITKLSRYNDSDTCGGCSATKRQSNHDETHELVKSVNWL